MGNNPSRAAPQHHHHHQSASSSASASPTTAPARGASPSASSAAAARKPGYRRNSLQSPGSVNVKYGTPTSQDLLSSSPSSSVTRPRQDVGGAGGAAAAAAAADFSPSSSDYFRSAHPPPNPPRREGVAATIPENSYNVFPSRTREDLLEDAASLRLFPSQQQQQHPHSQMPATTAAHQAPTPYAFNVNPFGPQSIPNRQLAGEGMKQGRGSMDSTTASLDEELSPEPDARAVPTLIQWPAPGTKVYVTGTFCAWEKRYRLTRNLDDNMMSAVVAIPPGTHHVKFLVDGEMTTSPSLPTAVDDTGILVNYLEVSADDMPLLNRQLTPGGSAHPGNPRAPDSSDRVPPIFPAESQLHYTTEIPSYLKEYVDSPYDEDNANGYAEGAPSPPSLPMMLQKVILNDNSQKDDASVLNSPNHAVLNHLATSSIKNSILAVSATTRYKKKYVTTILYKAASSHDD